MARLQRKKSASSKKKKRKAAKAVSEQSASGAPVKQAALSAPSAGSVQKGQIASRKKALAKSRDVDSRNSAIRA